MKGEAVELGRTILRQNTRSGARLFLITVLKTDAKALMVTGTLMPHIKKIIVER
jgi:hypothetical protein